MYVRETFLATEIKGPTGVNAECVAVRFGSGNRGLRHGGGFNKWLSLSHDQSDTTLDNEQRIGGGVPLHFDPRIGHTWVSWPLDFDPRIGDTRA